MLSICVDCGDLTADIKRARCPRCYPAFAQRDSQHRSARRKRDGRNEAWWTRFRQLVLQRDGNRCLDCKATTNLHAHYKPRGKHSRRLDDYETLCGRCHPGRHTQGGLSRSQEIAPRAPRPRPPHFDVAKRGLKLDG
jgi:hypothetical protein